MIELVALLKGVIVILFWELCKSLIKEGSRLTDDKEIQAFYAKYVRPIVRKIVTKWGTWASDFFG
ncbi:hypothetical protein [Furfurilactobacillus rossiae]|uniref:hypothetical protein n=1 Tax=Furfurilactobacillus rossiae TaxID=231049 RepID=UPI0015BCAB06|nr:hypothetical protein [Furfurilactobacillus rossiae]